MTQHFIENGVFHSINAMNSVKPLLEITLGRRNLFSDVFFSAKNETLGIDHKGVDKIKKTWLSFIKSSWVYELGNLCCVVLTFPFHCALDLQRE